VPPLACACPNDALEIDAQCHRRGGQRAGWSRTVASDEAHVGIQDPVGHSHCGRTQVRRLRVLLREEDAHISWHYMGCGRAERKPWLSADLSIAAPTRFRLLTCASATAPHRHAEGDSATPSRGGGVCATRVQFRVWKCIQAGDMQAAWDGPNVERYSGLNFSSACFGSAEPPPRSATIPPFKPPPVVYCLVAPAG
jgi:hypothetical protein